MRKLSLTVAMFSVALAIACVDYSCPTVDYDEFLTQDDVGRPARDMIDDTIKSNLHYPDSYERKRIKGSQAEVSEREDGSRYYSPVFVSFSAENALGARLTDQAIVVLGENSEQECYAVFAGFGDSRDWEDVKKRFGR